jgi:uncharacterized membrane protein
MLFCHFRNLSSDRSAWTLIDLLALVFVVAVAQVTVQIVTRTHGLWAGIAAGILAAIVSGTIVVLFYRAGGRRSAERRRMLTEKYPNIYRVLSLPTDDNCIRKAKYARIAVGDYGWEAEPLNSDSLIYLQGLSSQWRLVWHAGFRPEQIEKVGPKPRSQYYIPYAWRAPNQPPPCPYPVQKDNPPTMGYPI